MFTACGDDFQTTSSTSSIAPQISWVKSGQSNKPIDSFGTSIPADLNQVRITVSGSGIATPITETFDATLRNGTVAGIPAGSNRSVLVEELNSRPLIIY
jgi:hypothetical protein